MSASNRPMGGGAASGGLSRGFASSAFPPPSAGPPSAYRPQLTPPPPNNCDRLLAVARVINARPVYQTVYRVGGEDHRPLFSAEVQLMPQGYFIDGTGHSKLAARRAAAGNMVNFLHQRALLPNSFAQEPHYVAPSRIQEPYYQNQNAQNASSSRANNCDDEIEDGELPPADAVMPPVATVNPQQDTNPPLFFVDRDPDPELEVVAESFAIEHNSEQEPHPVPEEGDKPSNDGQKHPVKEEQNPAKEEQQAANEQHQAVKEDNRPVQATPATPSNPSEHAEPPKPSTAAVQPDVSSSAGPSSSNSAPTSAVSIPRSSPVATSSSSAPLPAPAPDSLPPAKPASAPIPPAVSIPRYSPSEKPLVSPRLRSAPTPVSAPVPHSAVPVRPAVPPTIRGPQLDSEFPLPRIKRLPLPMAQPAPSSRSAAMSLNRMMHSTSTLPSASLPVPGTSNAPPVNRIMLRSAAAPQPPANVPDEVPDVVMVKPEPKQISVGTQSSPAKLLPAPNSEPVQPTKQETSQSTPRSQPVFPPVVRPLPKPAFPFQPTKQHSGKVSPEVKPEPTKAEIVTKSAPGPSTKEPPNVAKPAETKRNVKTVLRSAGPPRKWREGPTRADEEEVKVKDPPLVRRSTRGRGSAGLVIPRDLDMVEPLVIVVPPNDVEIPTRKRADPPSPTAEDAAKDAAAGFIPLRKRARSIVKEGSPADLPVRLHLSFFCDQTEDKVSNSLHALIRANLFVELELHVFVERAGTKQLKADTVVKVQELPKNGQNAQVVFTRLVFEAGKACEQLWVRRAKHLADDLPPALCPRIIIIHESPALAFLSKPGVIDVLKPEVELVDHVGKLLEAATKELTSL